MPENDSQQNDPQQNDSQQNDSQQNDSQQSCNMEKRRERLRKSMLICKHAFWQIASKYNGKVRYVSQHGIIWSGKYFSPDDWEGLCMDFSIEWVRQHVRRGDFTKDLIQARNELATSMKCSNKYLSNLTPVDATVDRTGLLIGKDFVRYDGRFESRYPFLDVHLQFKRDRYHIITTDDHVNVCYVHNDGKSIFYDAGVGEAADLSSVKFVGEYLFRVQQLSREFYYPYIDKSLYDDVMKKQYTITVEMYVPVRQNTSMKKRIMSLFKGG